MTRNDNLLTGFDLGEQTRQLGFNLMEVNNQHDNSSDPLNYMPSIKTHFPAFANFPRTINVQSGIICIERRPMPNICLTEPMEACTQGQIKSATYASLNEVVRTGIRMMVERDGARQFYALKADLEHAVRDVEAGAFTDFDPRAYEPDAG